MEKVTCHLSNIFPTAFQHLGLLIQLHSVKLCRYSKSILAIQDDVNPLIRFSTFSQISATMASSLVLKEVTTRSKIDAIIDIVWAANYIPYRPLISGIPPIFGPTTADREADIASSKDRYWKSHIPGPSSHWFYVQDQKSEEVLGGVQWQAHETNSYPNGPVPLHVD